MFRPSPFEEQWDELIALCQRKQEFHEAHKHPKLLKFISKQIDHLATEMGFSSREIRRGNFVRSGVATISSWVLPLLVVAHQI
jgi:hypothetical protein